MAIIDSNGNLQIASAIHGQTDFGCWNILAKHFGDVSTNLLQLQGTKTLEQ